MEDYITYILTPSEDGVPLAIDRVTAAGSRLTDEFLYRGSLTYLPLPNGCAAICAAHGKSKPAMTEWLIRTLAGELQAVVLDEEGVPAFLDSEDNDVSFLESIPAPEEESGAIRLIFTIQSDKPMPMARILAKVDEFDYEYTTESDGIAVALSSNIYLDLFFSNNDTIINGDVDLTFAGARLYLDALNFACKLAKEMDATINAVPDPRITYPMDRDIEKLRRVFYLPLKQQLSYAVMDDRDGIQAFLGWGTDNVEPSDIPGTIVSPFGRFSIERLRREIRTFGFSWVADHYLLSCNTPSRGADFQIRSGLILSWNHWLGRHIGDIAGADEYAAGGCRTPFDQVLKDFPGAPFPVEFYQKLCATSGREPMDTSKCVPYVMHYEPGYRLDDLYYGFGHYLRRVKLPGNYPHVEMTHGFDGVILDDFFDDNHFTLEFAIKYFDTDAQPTDSFGANYAHGEVETFDIGGSAIGRFCRGECVDGRWRAEAEIVIRDERYHFAVSTTDPEMIDMVRDSLMASRSIEEWYDDYGGDEFDPHAPGGTFCINGDMIEPEMHNPFPDERYDSLLHPLPEDEENPEIDERYNDAEARYNRICAQCSDTFQPLMLRPINDKLFETKVGGAPYLPEGTDIPEVAHTDATVSSGAAGKPLDFICQLNFSDFDLENFPKKGILSIWAQRDPALVSNTITRTQDIFHLNFFPDAPESETAAFIELLMGTTPDPDRSALALMPQHPVFGKAEVSTGAHDHGCRIGGTPHFLVPELRAQYDTLLLRLDNLMENIIPPFMLDRPYALELAINGEALKNGDFSDVLLAFVIE